MLPLLALTYTATRLGLEAQSAAASRPLEIGCRYHQKRRSNRSRVPHSARRHCSGTGSGRAETALHREEGSQKIGAGWATPEAGQAKVGHFSSFAQIFQLRL